MKAGFEVNFDYETFLQTGGAFWHAPTTQNNGRCFGDETKIDEIMNGLPGGR